jgi:hypothetical protein
VFSSRGKRATCVSTLKAAALQEAVICISQGLLALGNVITALDGFSDPNP